MIKRGLLVFVILIILNTFLSLSVLAEQRGYVPLEPLPGMRADKPVKVGEYLSLLYQFGIILGAVLAVFMIVYGGIVYMTAAGNPWQATKGKDTIWSAIWGLLLILVSYMVLEIINPNLVNWSSTTNIFFK